MGLIEIRIPAGPPLSIVLARWHVAHGAAVAAGDPLFELETEKASVDYPSPAGGAVEHVAAAGAALKRGQLIGRVRPLQPGPAPC